ncbi:MAG: hypothetical protein EAX96_05615 [Candidatus Lokiarchaeota archaeon]|nr:hypothetical protein [Candidatus Lokiarchaeota archaeon]
MKFGIDLIAKTIAYEIEAISQCRVHVAIADNEGNYYFVDPVYNEKKGLISTLVKNIFESINVGDDLKPILNEDILFFKTTPNSMTILQTLNGNIDQLYAFKEIMNDHYQDIEDYIARMGPAQVIEYESHKLVKPTSQPQKLMSFNEFIATEQQSISSEPSLIIERPETDITSHLKDVQQLEESLNSSKDTQEGVKPDRKVVYSTPDSGFLSELKAKLQEKSNEKPVKSEIKEEILKPEPLKDQKRDLLKGKSEIIENQLLSNKPVIEEKELLTNINDNAQEKLLTDIIESEKEELLIEKPIPHSGSLIEEQSDSLEEKKSTEKQEIKEDKIVLGGEVHVSKQASDWVKSIQKLTKKERELAEKEEKKEKKPLEKPDLQEKILIEEKSQVIVDSSTERTVEEESDHKITIPPNLLVRRSFFNAIKPSRDKIPKKNVKLTLNETVTMENSNGKKSLLQIMEENSFNYSNLIKYLDKLFNEKIITFQDYEFIKLECPECKKEAFLFIPKFLKENCTKYMRAQVFPLECDHTFITLFDKKLKVIIKSIEKLLNRKDYLDFTDINIENLIEYFGQDMIFYIFHHVFYEKHITFIGEWDVIQYIVAYIASIFREYANNPVINCIDRDEFVNNSKFYKDHLIIDLNSLISLDPSDEELTFGFQLSLFKEGSQSFENFYRTHMRGK